MPTKKPRSYIYLSNLNKARALKHGQSLGYTSLSAYMNALLLREVPHYERELGRGEYTRKAKETK
jgi:hypothetical protein